MKYDIAVFMGRFQPFHLGHQAVVDYALSLADKVVILVGSVDQNPSIPNPWNFEHREKMIRGVYVNEDRLIIKGLPDITYNNDAWIYQVQSIVADVASEFGPADQDPKITLVGCAKDHTSWYLKLFPKWESSNVEFVNPINATDIRASYFAENSTEWKRRVAPATKNYLEWFSQFKEFQEMQFSIDWHMKYRETVKKYPRIEQTVDSVVTVSGHILLIQRRAAPGKGLWALPGGFLNAWETKLQGAIRELSEETKIDIPKKVLIGSIAQHKSYDDPRRSDRGRLITEAFHFDLENRESLPKIKGSDDAARAKWFTLAEANSMLLFEDHNQIIKDILGLY